VNFCLYDGGGPHALTCFRGMAFNCVLVTKYYPGWECLIFYDSTVPKQVLDELTRLGAKLHDCTDLNWPGAKLMAARFLTMDPEMGYEYSLSRDADSRITPREVEAVERWIAKKEFPFMSMHDSISHNIYMMGGMISWRPCVRNIRAMIDSYFKAVTWTPAYGWDQEFLSMYIEPRAIAYTEFVGCHWSRFHEDDAVDFKVPIAPGDYHVGACHPPSDGQLEKAGVDVGIFKRLAESRLGPDTAY